MKFAVEKDALKWAVTAVERLTPTRSTLMDVLETVRIRAEKRHDGGVLEISATDLRIAMTVVLKATVDADGDLLVKAKTLHDFLGASERGDLTAELTGANLVLRVGSARGTFEIRDAADFPEPPSGLDDLPPVVLMDADALRGLVDGTAYAVLADESRPAFQGLLLECESGDDIGSITLTGVDGFQLARRGCSADVSESKTALIPATAMRSIAGAARGSVALQWDDRHVYVEWAEGHATAQLLAHEFPEYRRIIRSEHATTFRCKRTELSNAVRMATIFSDANTPNGIGLRAVEFRSIDDGLQVQTWGGARGNGAATIGAEITGEPVHVIASGRYMIAALDAIHSDMVEIGLAVGMGAISITGDGGDASDISLVMPLQDGKKS